MTKEEAKAFSPILAAFAEGKIIECRIKPSSLKGSDTPNKWSKMESLEYWNNTEYRIKPESKYRPFAKAEECWQEMQKHQPFGWVKNKEQNIRTGINYIHNEGVMFSCGSVSFERIINIYTFADGTPFGIMEE